MEKALMIPAAFKKYITIKPIACPAKPHSSTFDMMRPLAAVTPIAIATPTYPSVIQN
jgi:hypothetical protein